MTKIMLIDDDESLQVLIGQIAERDGYEYCCAANGAEGLSMLRAERPDFLILDVMLPDTNGYDICETIRGEGRKIPIMFLSAKAISSIRASGSRWVQTIISSNRFSQKSCR